MQSSECLGKKVAIKSIGCRTNQEEMVTLRFQLENAGYEVVDEVATADFIIMNTCAVTSSAETKTRRLLSAIVSSAPDARILVTGCLAQQKPAELADLSNVEWVVGNTFKNDIAAILIGDRGVFHSSFEKTPEGLPLDDLNVVVPSAKRILAKTRFPVKIQEGCDFRCSYCVVPSLRGPSRCAQANSVIDICKQAVDAGYKELVLTGTHIGQYGNPPGESLLSLLQSIAAIKGDFRIRLSSLDPRDLSDDLLSMIGSNEHLCDHLHVSVQSLSNDVLEKMNRPYEDLDVLIERLVNFRKQFPLAGLGADLIVGFPGETDDNIFETIDNVKKIGFSYAHIFRYSLRPGTAAAVFPEQVSEMEKSRRAELLRNVIDESRKSFLQRMHGVQKKIIVESKFPVRGLTSNYLHVEIPELKGERNTWLDISVTGSGSGRFCLAEPVICEVV